MLKKSHDVANTLDERGTRYGDFTTHAGIAQCLKSVMQETMGWERLTPDKREALEMIQHKVARILNGDSNYKDNWHDIAGYAILAEERCNEKA